MDNTLLWQSVLSDLETKISKPAFITWFRDTNIKKREGEKVIISVPNIFVKEWLLNKFSKELLVSFKKISPGIKGIKYIISIPEKKISEKQGGAFQKPLDISQPSFDFQQNRLCGLNPKYRFKNFVVGNFNQLAHACAISIIKNIKTVSPGRGQKELPYNPLFLYSGVGLGKTHLLEAVGNEIIGIKKRKKVKYIPCPNFTSQIISGIRDQSIEKIIENYNRFDILIIDDVEFIAGKERTQEIFFRVFNNLAENGSQVILSSDRPPKAIEKLEEHLRSRFEGGMVIDINSPDFEERLAILEQKLEEKEGILPQEILEFIAKNIKKNIRELEGTLIKAMILFQKDRSFEKVKQHLQSIIEEPKKRISPDKIIDEACSFYNISKKDILSKSRKKELVLPRQVAMYLLREETGLSFPSIGAKIGKKDHTTVCYACGKVGEKLKKDVSFIKDLEAIKERVFNS